MMPNKLQTLLPPTLLSHPVQAATELPRAVMMRVNFIPGVRQRLGWRGVRECTEGGGLTAKIAESLGVYAISLAETSSCDQQGTAVFNLYYFPSPDEELLECFSVAGGIEVLREDYLDRVREFSGEEGWQTLFRLAKLEVNYNIASSGVGLVLKAADQQILISADGVAITGKKGEEQVVPPNGVDQDLAAFAIILPFFEILATSFSFCLGHAPERLQERSRPGRKIIYSQNDRYSEKPTEDSREHRLALEWGDESGGMTADSEFPHLDISWEKQQEKPQKYKSSPWWTSQVPGAKHSLDKNSMGITERPKLIVLTGFLGSGKTSFLNHFIEYQAERNAFVAIVQNEVGAKGLDGHLLGQHYAVTEMDEGCICCTLAGNLKLALTEILAGFQPDFVVLETTGLANPANFLAEIAELEEQLDFCSITTVVDSSQGISPLEKFAVAREQLMLADVILANKVNDVTPQQLTTLKEWIKDLNPLAVVHETNQGDISPAQLYGVNYTGKMRTPDIEQHNGHTHIEEGISSLLVKPHGQIEREKFLTAAATFPPEVLRVKGVLTFKGETAPMVYQYVPGSQTLSPITEIDPEERFLVLIGVNIQRSAKPFLQSLQLEQVPPSHEHHH